MPIFTSPLTLEQEKLIEARKQPSAEDIRRAQDDLFMYLLTRVAELEAKLGAVGKLQ